MVKKLFTLQSYRNKDISEKENDIRKKTQNMIQMSGIAIANLKKLERNTLSSKDDDYDIYSYAKNYVGFQTDYIAYNEMNYDQRVQYLMDLAADSDISYILDTIADSAIVPNKDNMFCFFDADKLKSKIRANYENVDNLLETCEKNFNKIYTLWNFHDGDEAWKLFRKWLIKGVLAYEIIYSYDKSTKNAKGILGFKELEPSTLEPAIVHDENGTSYKIWYQYRDTDDERKIPDSNIIYISFAGENIQTSQNISYLETINRPFNVLRQLENSRLIWNIQNAQKRVKFVVPVSGLSTQKERERIEQLKAYYTEETMIDPRSGIFTVNAQPKFSFSKTFLFPSVEGSQTDISEIDSAGYDMNSTESLNYYYRRFILQTHIPPSRFFKDMNNIPQTQANLQSISQEEIAFARYINRLRSVFKELIIKPLWISIMLDMPELIVSSLLKSYLSISYNEENVFARQKEADNLTAGANIITTLSTIMKGEQPYFSIDFLIKKFLGMSDEDLNMNEEYKQHDVIKMIKSSGSASGGENGGGPGMDMGADMSGAPDAGMDMGADTGGALDAGMDMGADTGGAPDAGMDMGADTGGTPADDGSF